MGVVARNIVYAFKLLLMSLWDNGVLYEDMIALEKDVIWMPAKVSAQDVSTGDDVEYYIAWIQSWP